MLKEQERLLFDRWKEERNYKCFVSDGIFNEEEWKRQSIKITYLLKEVNCWKTNRDGSCGCSSSQKESLNLCEYLLSEKSPTYWKTWNNIVRWTQAIRYGGEYPQYISKADKTSCLKTISALNIKKEAGKARSDNGEILKYGQADSDFIRQQIELYQPDIIVCCGNGNIKNADILFKHILTASEYYKTSNGYTYCLCTLNSGKTIPVISFRHPQMWGSHRVFKKYFDDMSQISNELKKLCVLKGE